MHGRTFGTDTSPTHRTYRPVGVDGVDAPEGQEPSPTVVELVIVLEDIGHDLGSCRVREPYRSRSPVALVNQAAQPVAFVDRATR